MKNMIKLKYIICIVLCISLNSCADDDLNYPDPNKPVVTSSVSNTTLGEGESLTFTLNLSRAIGNPADIKIEQVSGNATVDDYSFSIGELDEYEIGPAGYQTSIPATQTSTEVTFTPTLDLDVEGTETATFRIVKGQNGLATIEGGEILFTVSITNFDYCLWTLEATDVYGDGWNGAYIELVTEGNTTTYFAHDDFDLFEIPVRVGADYSFTYVSGGGTGGAPGWESENYYELTAPDGTVFADGTLDYSGIPTPGLITSGISSCD